MLNLKLAAIAFSISLLCGCGEGVSSSPLAPAKSAPAMASTVAVNPTGFNSPSPWGKVEATNANTQSTTQPLKADLKVSTQLNSGLSNATPASPEQIPSLIAGTTFEAFLNKASSVQEQPQISLAGTPFEAAMNNASAVQQQPQQIPANLIGTPFEAAIRQANALKTQKQQP